MSQPSADLAPMLGDGPARPVGLAPAAVLDLSPPANFGSSTWGGQKVVWALDSHAQRPVLVRGRQLDGDSDVRFNTGDIPAADLVLDAAADTQALDGSWYGFAGYTRVEHEGCYGYQIDNEDSTTIVVFAATKNP